MILSFDTEDTGLDFHHGARPFFVTTCCDQGNVRFWEWPVNPLTRQPVIPEEDLDAIQALLVDAEQVVLQNAKFDVNAMTSVALGFGEEWPWEKTRDTLIAGHLLASNHPHDLTSMALAWLGVDIKPVEEALEVAVKKARSVIQQAKLRAKRGKNEEPEPLAAWRIAEEGLPEMPSAKGSCWNYDYWLPRALVCYWWETSEAGKKWIIEEFLWTVNNRVSGVRRLVAACSQLDGWEYRPPSKFYEGHHSWWTVLSEYANKDSEVTLPLWTVQIQEIRRRGLERIFEERMRALPVAWKMEARGVTISRACLTDLREEYREQSARAGRVCQSIAADLGFELTLPKSGNNGCLIDCCFGPKVMEEIADPETGELRTVWTGRRDRSQGLDLPPRKRSQKTGEPSLDKEVLAVYEVELPSNSPQLTFVKNLKGKRKRDTALGFMESYEKFWVPWIDGNGAHVDWFRLHPSFNMTGTDTLRWSCSNPNAQQISKQESDCPTCKGEGCDRCGGTGEDLHSLRRMFGPAPGREWWSFDYENIELRIPAYESGERAMVELFENPDAAPYFGSYHLLNASLIYPDLFNPIADQKGKFKKLYGSTWYQWDKNFGFAFQYGGGRETCDRAAHKVGSYDAVQSQLPELAKLNQRYITQANKLGYVETIPDKTVDPRRGYPVMCSRTEYGRVSPTVPLNYHVQSTAMWCTMKAMIRIQKQLDAWREEDGFDGAITMQVHDEIVMDFPLSAVSPKEDEQGSNLWRAKVIQNLMEESGIDIGIPLRTSLTLHLRNWSEGDL